MLSRCPLPAAVLALAALTAPGCGKAVPRYQLHTAPEWVAMLGDPDVRVRTAAFTAITQFAVKAPDAVLAALEEGLSTPPPLPSASPFSVAVDLDGGTRLGLAPMPATDAAAFATEVLRGRALTAGVTPMSIKALGDGTIDIVISHPLPRAAVERVQAVFCTRGALEIRVLVPDPAAGPVGGAARAVVYDGKVPYADYLGAEARGHVAAREAKLRHVSSEPRWRAVPRTAAATLPADFVLVEEPASEADALDERMVLAAAAGDASGRAVVTVRVKAERRGALRRFSTANAGLSMAVVLDGVLLGLQPVPKTDGETLDLALWPKGSVAGPPEAADLAVVLAAGRLPWPLRAIPLEPTYGTDPPADNLISRAFTVLDERAIPTLERIAAKAPLSWSRSSARWALDQIKASSGAPGR